MAFITTSAVVSGCSMASCETEPFAGLPVAAIHPPPLQHAPTAIAACLALVTFNGVDYAVSSHGWQIPEGSLSSIGEASGANLAAGSIGDREVFKVDGLDPTDAIAMRIGPGGSVTLLIRGGGELPASACRYLVGAARDECLDGAQSG